MRAVQVARKSSGFLAQEDQFQSSQGQEGGGCTTPCRVASRDSLGVFHQGKAEANHDADCCYILDLAAEFKKA
jgi:hypothetical protein